MKNKQVVNYIKESFELKNQGYFKPAIEMLYKALSIESDNVEILAQLAHLYKLLENYSRAIYYIEKVFEIDGRHSDCLFLLKEIYTLEENIEKANEVVEKIYEIQPISKNLAEKIKFLKLSNKFDEIKKIENNTELKKDFDDAVLYELACSYSKTDTAKAIEFLESAYNQNKTNENILLLLGKIYYSNQNMEKAKKLFLELEKINPHAEVLNYLGLFKLNDRELQKATKYFQKALNLESTNHEYAYNLASAYFLQGWVDEALRYFNQAICLAPDNINYHYSLAYLYYQKGSYDKAAKELDYISTLDKNHELSQILDSLIRAKKGDLIGAKAQLEKIVKTNPNDDFAFSALSKIYKELLQNDLAKETIKKAIELNPKSLDYLSDLVELEIEQKNYEEATTIAEKILELNNRYIYGHIAIAKINLELKNYDQVFDSAQEIIELDQSCPEGYYYNALALFSQGDSNFAIESLKKSISLDVNNATLYIKMSEFYQDINDLKTAYEWAKEAAEIEDKSYQNKWLCAKLALALHKTEEAGKYYTQSYRLASFDTDLAKDYANYLQSIGKDKQAKALLK